MYEKTTAGAIVFSRSLVMKMLHLYRELLLSTSLLIDIVYLANVTKLCPKNKRNLK